MSIIIQTLIMIDQPPSTDNKLLLPLLDNFLLYLKTNNYSDETLSNYERDLQSFNSFLQTEISKHFDKLTKADIETYKAYLLSNDRKTTTTRMIAQTKLQSGSVNRMLSSLRGYFKFLIYQDYKIPIQPESIKMVRKEKKHYKVAELEELISLIEAPTKFEKDPIVSTRNRAMLEVLFATGIRISELLSLNRRDIDPSGKIFIVGKGKKERFVYLTPRSLTYLEHYLKLRLDNLPALFVPQKGKRRNQKDCRISTNYLQDKIKKYREKLGIIVPTSAHSLRHGFATYLAEQGASPVAIQMLLGHESLNTTTRYVNASDRFAQEAHKKFHPLSEDPDDS